MEKILISSNAFENGGTIPKRFTCDGEDLSPALSWTGVPDGAKSLALIMDDPDAPVGTFTHWVIYNVPAYRVGFDEGVVKEESPEDGSLQGVTDFRRVGYNGPCPPTGGAHRYYFKIYAIDTVLSLPPQAEKSQLEDAMDGHVLGRGELIGRYGR